MANKKIYTWAESINIMSKTIGPAIRERNKVPIQKMAVEETEAGADFLDLNLGPARKAGDETMDWLVRTVEEVVDTPLILDTMNPLALEAGLKAAKKNLPIINSISAQPESLASKMPLVEKYGCDFVALTLSEEGIPRDANERAMCLVTIMTAAAEKGIANEKLWVDPIVLPLSVDLNQVLSFMEFMPMVQEICPGAKSTCGLSNVSNGAPTDELRRVLNRTYLMMLRKVGLYGAIVDSYDKELMDYCNGQMQEVEDLVFKMMDGYEPDIKSLSPKQQEYAKSVRVLLGKVLYSHSWLES
jgi:5-methyltetrahydrofolate corrinoid/iron sulfur protein methyltransferase